MGAMLQAGVVDSRPVASRPIQVDDGFFTYHGLWAPGVRLLRQLNFMAKSLLMSVVFLLPLLSIMGWQLKEQSDRMLKDRIDATRQHVEIAHGILAWAQAQEAAGHMSREQAQRLAKQQIATLRYDGSEHFWINDMQPRMVMHPLEPELDGKDLSEIKDADGLPLFKAFVDTVRREGRGFVGYPWPKPGSEQPVDRVSYVMGFEPWGWIVGSGVYVGDVHARVVQQAKWFAGVIAVMLLLAGYLFACVYRVMDGGVRETQRHLTAMTTGDLTTTPTPWGRDEPARLMFDLARMQHSLRTMVQQVRHSSDDIVRSSSEIASGATDLSARTGRAATNLERSAASMEEITSTVKTTSDNTAEAARVAEHNAEAAADGGRAMRDVVATMEGIRASSARIGEIIGTIDGIAFQTNILALNAAVEAARAGGQGRGFAVVAGEVRALAQRSAAAAREIKELISGSVAQVESGTGVVREAGDRIEQIVASSQRVNQLLNEIASGAREQSAGIGQIDQAVQELDGMTQQNATLVEQTATAAAALRDRAHVLAGLVRRFRLPDAPAVPESAPD